MCWLIYIFVSLKLKSRVNNFPYLGNSWFKVSNILMVDACGVTPIYAKLTFCINSILSDSFKIVFLLETTLFFSWHYLSCEVCMIYPDCYYLSGYQLPFMGMSTPSLLCAWIFLSMVIKIGNFKCYLHCVSMENFFTICIFGISVKNWI